MYESIPKPLSYHQPYILNDKTDHKSKQTENKKHHKNSTAKWKQKFTLLYKKNNTKIRYPNGIQTIGSIL